MSRLADVLNHPLLDDADDLKAKIAALVREYGHKAGCRCGQHDELCYHQKAGDGCSMRDPRCLPEFREVKP